MYMKKTAPAHVVHAYIRVSRDEQTLDQQKEVIENAYPEGTVFAWYGEYHSAWTGRRKEYEDLKSGIMKGNVKEITVFSISRLGRNLRELHMLLDLIRLKSVKLNVVSQPFDFNGPFGTLIFTMFGEIAQMESDMKSSSIKAKFVWQKKNGTFVPHGNFPGCIKQSLFDKAEAIYDMLKEKKSYKYIADMFEISINSVEKLVARKGKLLYTRKDLPTMFPGWERWTRAERFRRAEMPVPADALLEEKKIQAEEKKKKKAS